MSRTVDINPALVSAVRDARLPMDDTLGMLILLHHGVKPTYIPQDFIRRVLASGIVTYDATSKTYDWRYGLYEGGNTQYDWIKEWMDLFKVVNPDRRGTKASVVKRMKDFFANYPQYNVDNVMAATRAYLQTVTNPQYCKTSHKFIKEQDGSSMLLEQLEKTKTGRDRRMNLDRLR